LVRLEAKSGNPNGHIGSMHVKATKQNLRTCREHGTWPGFWQLASAPGGPLRIACRSQLDTSSTLSAISSIATAYRKDWHSRCTSLFRGSAGNALGTGRHRMSSLAMVALMAAAFGFNPAARAQDVPTPSGAQGQVQSVGNNSTQETHDGKSSGFKIVDGKSTFLAFGTATSLAAFAGEKSVHPC
jgi:hypothetical protein